MPHSAASRCTALTVSHVPYTNQRWPDRTGSFPARETKLLWDNPDVAVTNGIGVILQVDGARLGTSF